MPPRKAQGAAADAAALVARVLTDVQQGYGSVTKAAEKLWGLCATSPELFAEALSTALVRVVDAPAVSLAILLAC